MAKSCSNCQYLDIKKKKPGRSGGNLYHCKKLNTLVNPYRGEICEKYEKDWGRSKSVIEEIETDGKNFDDRDTNITKPLIALILVIILGIISLLFAK